MATHTPLTDEQVAEQQATATNGTKSPETTLAEVAAKATKEFNTQLVIPKIDAETLIIPIIGTSPLILHKFSKKARQQMLDNMQGQRKPKTNRDPQADYREAFYRHDPDAAWVAAHADHDYCEDGQPGMPVIAYKSATVSAARLFPKNVTMTMLRQCLFFRGFFSQIDRQQLVKIEGKPQIREDVVTVGNGGTDLRYRPEFEEWQTELSVTYVKSMLTKESVLALVDAGGMGVGVGEWRPEKNGDFGTFQIDESREIRAT